MKTILEFMKDVPQEAIVPIFNSYFNHTNFVYDLLCGVDYIRVNSVDVSDLTITFFIELPIEANMNYIVPHLIRKASMMIMYGRRYDPYIALNGNTLEIIIRK